MGEVISMMERRARIVGEAPAVRLPVRYAFDPRSPEAYLAAERVERLGANVTWVPVLPAGPVTPTTPAESARLLARAAALRLPLVWPEVTPASPRLVRIAALAADAGVLPAFALASGRLAYCGGFDLDDPEIVAEAAAAAGLDLDACLAAAADPSRDATLRAEAERLAATANGPARLPAFEVGRTVLFGEDQLPAVLAASRARPRSRRAG